MYVLLSFGNMAIATALVLPCHPECVVGVDWLCLIFECFCVQLGVFMAVIACTGGCRLISSWPCQPAALTLSFDLIVHHRQSATIWMVIATLLWLFLPIVQSLCMLAVLQLCLFVICIQVVKRDFTTAALSIQLFLLSLYCSGLLTLSACVALLLLSALAFYIGQYCRVSVTGSCVLVASAIFLFVSAMVNNSMVVCCLVAFACTCVSFVDIFILLLHSWHWLVVYVR